jgi:FtsH-binding integral membrane protein
LGKVAVDEYILGALLLYIDIIRMLLYILLLFAKAK